MRTHLRYRARRSDQSGCCRCGRTQPSHNGSYSVLECPGNDTPMTKSAAQKKGMTGGDTDGIREDCLIIKDSLGRIHERVDILGRGSFVGRL